MPKRQSRFRFAATLVLFAVPLVVACNSENTHTNPPPPAGDQDAAAAAPTDTAPATPAGDAGS